MDKKHKESASVKDSVGAFFQTCKVMNDSSLPMQVNSQLTGCLVTVWCCLFRCCDDFFYGFSLLIKNAAKICIRSKKQLIMQL